MRTRTDLDFENMDLLESSKSTSSSPKNASGIASRQSLSASIASSEPISCTHQEPMPSSLFIEAADPSVPCRKQKVHWGRRLTVCQILHVNDMSSDLRRSIWYTPEDYAAIRQQNVQTLRLMSVGVAQTTSDTLHCTRGLEHRTKHGSRAKQELKVTTLIAVLGEQERLQKNKVTGTAASEALAKAYQQVSMESQTAAFVRGLKDEQDVQEYLNLSGTTTGCSHDSFAMMEEICLDDDVPTGASFLAEREEEGRPTRLPSQPFLCGAAA